MRIENKNLYWPMELAFLVVFCYNFGHILDTNSKTRNYGQDF